MWWKKKKTTRTEVEQDAKEDLELKDEDADKVAGGATFGDVKGESTDSQHKD